MLTGLSQLAAYGQEITYIFAAIILAVFVCYIKCCYLQLGQKTKELENIRTEMLKNNNHNISDCYEEVNELFSKSDGLKDIWNLFKKSLVVTRNIYDDKQVVYSTVDADQYFNINNICFNVSVSFWQNLGGVFTGLGILGTFLGLSVGVSNIDISETALMQESIGVLLKGLGTAFYTSLIGIFVALIFNFIHKSVIDNLEKSIINLCNTLEIFCQRKSTEQFLADNYLLAKEQTDQFKSFSDNLAIAIGDALEQKLSESDMNDSLKNIENTILGIHTFLSNELANTINKQFEAQLLPVFERLTYAVEKLNNSSVDAISKGFEESAGKELRSLSTTLQSMTVSLYDVMEKMEQTSSNVNKELGESISNVIAELNNNMAQMQSQNEAREQNIKEVSDEVTSKLTKDIESLMNRLDEGLSQVTEHTQGLSATLADTSVRANEEIANVFATAGDKLTTLLDDYTQKNTALNVKLFTYIDDIQKGLGEQQVMLSKLNNQVNYVVEKAGDVADKFADAAHPVNDAVNVLNSSLKENIEATKNYNEQIIQGISDIKAVVHDNTNNIEELTANFDKARQGLLIATKGYENANNELERIMETIGNSLMEYNDKMRGNYEKSLKAYSDSVAAACQQLYSVVDELVEALDEYNNK